MTFILSYWLAFATLLAATGLAAWALIVRLRSGVWSWPLYLPAALLGSFGVGAFDFMPGWLSLTLCIAAAGVFARLRS